MLRSLQEHPHWLELAYDAAIGLLAPFRTRLKPGGRAERVFVVGERVSKGAVFDCRMCGQCVLHSTGMTCPMTCPKNLRNGPCGGVRQNGHCEVYPDRPCIWVQAVQRSARMPVYGQELLQVLPPVNRSLQDTSAWINELNGIAQRNPAGWVEPPAP